MRKIAKMMEGQDLSIFGGLPALKSDAVVPVDLAAPARPLLDAARLGKITVSCKLAVFNIINNLNFITFVIVAISFANHS